MHRLILTETFDTVTKSYIFTMKVLIANRKAKTPSIISRLSESTETTLFPANCY